VAHRLVYTPAAEQDFADLYAYIRDQRDPMIAAGYIGRIRARCDSLIDFPEQGTRRDEIAPGIRILGFERRVRIIFRVHSDIVEIVRILYGGRSLDSRPVEH
jgi:toxin ParE1/3/4